jgi:hypothetical protein
VLDLVYEAQDSISLGSEEKHTLAGFNLMTALIESLDQLMADP